VPLQRGSVSRLFDVIVVENTSESISDVGLHIFQILVRCGRDRWCKMSNDGRDEMHTQAWPAHLDCTSGHLTQQLGTDTVGGGDEYIDRMSCHSSAVNAPLCHSSAVNAPLW